MAVAVMLFTRDLRVHDNPALHAALDAADNIVPMFVLDSAITSSAFNRPNRAAFLADSLRDLDRALRHRGGRLVVRHGEVAKQVESVVGETGATEVHLSADYSRYAVRRLQRLRDAVGRAADVHTHHGLIVVRPAI